MDIKTSIANILNIELSDSWEIVDSKPDDNLYLIHYTKDANLTTYGSLRGVVVDVDKKRVVCRSFGHTPTAVMDNIVVGPDSLVHINDLMGKEHIINLEKTRIKFGFEGTLIRVFKHNGKVYHSSHRRLDISRSRWGSSLTFEEIYNDLGGPADNILFDENKDSPYVHLFIMVHPDVLNVTKDKVGQGYMVYLGPKQLWADDKAPLKIPETVSKLDEKRPILLSPYNIDLNAANQHLRYGFYDEFDDSQIDPRLRLGEFVIFYKLDDNGQIEGLLKVQSTAYQWRLTMRDNNPNLLNRFYQLVNGSYIRTDLPDGLADYLRKFPIITRYPINTIKQRIRNEGPFLVWPQQQKTEPIATKNDKLFNIWLGLLLAVPLDKQYEVSTMYDKFMADRSKLVKWLQFLDENVDIENSDIPGRAKRIITTARNFSKHKTAQGLNRENGKYLDIQTMTRQNIFYLVGREEGGSLYRLIKGMEEYNEPEEVPKPIPSNKPRMAEQLE